MVAPVRDEFSNLDISRQRRWQLRKQRDGRCIICGGKPVVYGVRCLRHRKQHIRTCNAARKARRSG